MFSFYLNPNCIVSDSTDKYNQIHFKLSVNKYVQIINFTCVDLLNKKCYYG